MSLEDKNLLSENHDSNFGTIYNQSFYDINNYYSQQLEEKTLYEFQTEYFGSDEEHLDDFMTLSGYNIDEMKSTIIKNAVENKILRSPTLISENIKNSSDPNAVTITDYGATLCPFNPIQFLIENADVLISAISFVGNNDITEENLKGLIRFATRHILCCPTGESRTWVPKSVIQTDTELHPKIGSELDNYTFTSEMTIPVSSFYKKLSDAPFIPNEKTVEFNLNHSDHIEGLFFKFRVSGYQLNNGSYNYSLSIFSSTPGQSESSLEMFSIFKNVSSSFMEALYAERHQMIFNITKAIGHNQVLKNGYGRLNIIENDKERSIILRLYRGLSRSIETRNFVYNYYMKGFINRLDEISNSILQKGDLNFDDLYNKKNKKKKKEKKEKKDDNDDKFIFDENNFSFQLNSECLCFQPNSDLCVPEACGVSPPVVIETPTIPEPEILSKKNPLYFLMN